MHLTIEKVCGIIGLVFADHCEGGDMDRGELGRRVLRYREGLGLSQTALAEQAGISRNYVSLIERGEARNVSMRVLDRLAAVLGVAPAVLTGQSEQDELLVAPTLRQLGLEDDLSFEIIDKLSRIPRRGQEPRSVQEWRELYKAIRPYLEEGG